MGVAAGQPAAHEVGDSSEVRPRSVFANRNFLLIWFAYGISACGDHLSELALLKTQDALHATNLTQMMAKITFVFMLPFLLFGPIAGVLADRMSRRGLMVFADVVRAAIMFSFAWLIFVCEPLGTWGPYLPLGLTGVFATLFSPSRSALLPTLIRPTQLVQANAMTAGLGIIATMGSTLIGGHLAKHYHPQVAFRLDAMTFIASAVLLLLIRPTAQAAHAVPGRKGSVFSEIRDGLRYIAGHRRVVELMLFAVLIWTAGSVVRVAIPAVVRDVYGGDYQNIGQFQAFLGGGMLAGALLLTGLGNSLRSELVITWALFGLGGAVGLVAFSVLAGFPAGLAMSIGASGIFLAGSCATGVMASYSALLQRILPNYVRGRVFGVTDLFTIGGLVAVTGLLGIPDWPGIDHWVGLLLCAVALVIVAAATGTLIAQRRRSPSTWQVAFWRGVNELYCRWWFRLVRVGPCTVPPRGAVMVVANHTCSIDPLLLVTATPRRIISFMIAHEYYDLPFVGRLVKMIECIPVRRDGQDTLATRTALRYLRDGKAVGLFPEGRISKPGERVPPRLGAAMMALHSRATVIPAFISGTRYADTVTGSFFQRHSARVRYGKPIDLSAYYGRVREPGVVEEVAELMMARIRELAED